MMSCDYPHPVSRTYQYKKITKPLLERKRRARINRCLDELKDLMVDALETEGENISKLEKADILELTVRHLQRLHASRPSGLSSLISTTADGSNETRWQSGFGHCAAEACKYLASLPGKSGEKLARHLANELQSSRKITVQIMSNEGETIPPTAKNIDSNSNHLQSHSDIDISPMAESHSTVSATSWPQYCEVSDGIEVQPPDNFTAQKNISGSNIISPSTPSINDDVNVIQNAPDTTVKDNRTEDDEEIDVERIDDNDPMWRPW